MPTYSGPALPPRPRGTGCASAIDPGTAIRRLLALVGLRADDVHGRGLGTVHSVIVDRESGNAQWLLIDLGDSHASFVGVPVGGVVAGAGHAWVPHDRARILGGPRILHPESITGRQERALCTIFGLPPTRGARLATWERRATGSRALLGAHGRVAWYPEPRAAARPTG